MFNHRLALALGCTVAELGERMTLDEWCRWQAYYQLEPFGGWWHTHLIETTIRYLMKPHLRKGVKIGLGDVFAILKPPANTQNTLRDLFAVMATGAVTPPPGGTNGPR